MRSRKRRKRSTRRRSKGGVLVGGKEFLTSNSKATSLSTLTPTFPRNAPLAMTTAAPAQQGPRPLTSSTSLQQQQRMSQPPAQPHTGLRTPSNRKTIYDRNLNRTRTAELSRASFAYLFSEMVGYAQKRVTGIQDLERRYVFYHGIAFSR